MKRQKLLHFAVDEDMDRRIKAVAAENDLSKSETIRQAINAGLEKFFVDSQGKFLKEKINEVIDNSPLLVQNNEYILQSYSLINSALKLALGLNADKIKSLVDEKVKEQIKKNMKVFEEEAKDFMNSEINRKNKE